MSKTPLFSTDQIRHYLELALEQAEQALQEKNYPIGALVVDGQGNVLSTQRNQCSTQADVTAHAEILNLRDLGMNNSSPDLTMFSSLEPCFGCSFFIARSEVHTIYSALKDPHKGGMTDLQAQPMFSDFFQKIEVVNEPFPDLKEKSKTLMREYFLSLGLTEKAKYYGYKA